MIGSMIAIGLSFMSLGFILFLVKFLYEVWWNPMRIQSALRSQGMKGPSYRFVKGNSQEMDSMRNEALCSACSDLSHKMLPRVQPHIYLWTKLHGKNYVCWLGPRPQFILTEPNLVKEILGSKDEVNYSKPEFEYHAKQLFGDGLVSTRGDKWYRQRKLANHAFHGDNLKGMIPEMIVSVETMVERWRKLVGKEMDVYQEFKLLTSEIISRTAFGSSYLEGQQIFDMLGSLAYILSKNIYKVRIRALKKLLKTKDDIEAEKLGQGIRNAILNMIKKRETEARMGELERSCGSDYLGVLIKAYKEEDKSKKISIDDLVDECKTFYIAGHEPTTNSLTWCIFLLAIHTDWQEKARNEVLEIFGQRHPTSDEISRLKIMSMIVNETLRLYAPISYLVKDVEKGGRLGKQLVAPTRMDVLIPPLALHNDPDIWGEDAHLFKPERFAQGVAKATNNNIAGFLPFGLGPRNCVGMNFALAEAKIALSMILQRYRFILSPSYVHSPTVLVSLCPAKGLPVILHPLEN